MDGEKDEKNAPVKVKAVMFDPVTGTVLWMNESASRDLPPFIDAKDPELGIEQAVPLGGVMGLPEAIQKAVRTGAPQHLQASLIPSKRATLSVAASLYPLPEGKLLLLTELGLDHKQKNIAGTETRRYGRRGL